MRPDSIRSIRRALLAAPLALALGACENMPLADIGPTLSDDEPLSAAVRRALDASPETMHQRIHVSTTGPATVRLAGTVDTEITRTFAEQTAERVEGVERVINTLYLRD